jgi:zinc protease
MDEKTLTLPGSWETAGAVAGSLASMVRYGYDDDYWDKYVAQVRSTSLSDVSKAAKDYVQPDRLVWVVVGDREKIEEEVRSLEYGEVTLLDVDGNPIAE